MSKIYSMAIGRYQCLPPHEGHIKLIRKVLDEGKNVCIAIRDTEKDEKNPYTVQERIDFIYKAQSNAIFNACPKVAFSSSAIILQRDSTALIDSLIEFR